MGALRAADLRIVYLSYGILAFLSMLWDHLSRGSFLFSWSHSRTASVLWILFSILIFIAYLISNFFLSRATEWGKQLKTFLIKILTPISYLQLVLLSLVTGFIEEWFFRGVLTSHFGVVVSSIIFALCHLVLVGKLWMWSVWSFIFGVMMAVIYQQTNDLLLCALIHSFINMITLIRLNNEAAVENQDLWATAGEL